MGAQSRVTINPIYSDPKKNLPTDLVASNGILKMEKQIPYELQGSRAQALLQGGASYPEAMPMLPFQSFYREDLCLSHGEKDLDDGLFDRESRNDEVVQLFAAGYDLEWCNTVVDLLRRYDGLMIRANHPTKGYKEFRKVFKAWMIDPDNFADQVRFTDTELNGLLTWFSENLLKDIDLEEIDVEKDVIFICDYLQKNLKKALEEGVSYRNLLELCYIFSICRTFLLDTSGYQYQTKNYKNTLEKIKNEAEVVSARHVSGAPEIFFIPTYENLHTEDFFISCPYSLVQVISERNYADSVLMWPDQFMGHDFSHCSVARETNSLLRAYLDNRPEWIKRALQEYIRIEEEVQSMHQFISDRQQLAFDLYLSGYGQDREKDELELKKVRRLFLDTEFIMKHELTHMTFESWEQVAALILKFRDGDRKLNYYRHAYIYPIMGHLVSSIQKTGEFDDELYTSFSDEERLIIQKYILELLDTPYDLEWKRAQFIENLFIRKYGSHLTDVLNIGLHFLHDMGISPMQGSISLYRNKGD